MPCLGENGLNRMEVKEIKSKKALSILFLLMLCLPMPIVFAKEHKSCQEIDWVLELEGSEDWDMLYEKYMERHAILCYIQEGVVR